MEQSKLRAFKAESELAKARYQHLCANIAKVSAILAVSLREIALAIKSSDEKDLNERIEKIVSHSDGLWETTEKLMAEVEMEELDD